MNKHSRFPYLLRIAVIFSLTVWGGLAMPAQAEDCSDYPNGILDGSAGTPAPSQLFIDRHCTILNYPDDNPFDTNISFYTSPGQNDERWIVIFDNVVHTGQMACNSVAGHKIWFTNGSSTAIQEGCQNYLIPVEKINKQNPAGETTASIGVPFTYSLTIPVLFDPGTGSTINTAGSVNTLHSVIVTDDLNATGVDLTYVDHEVYLEGAGTPISHLFTNVGGFLTFSNFFDPQSIIPAGEQIVIEITVVLEDSPANLPGIQFINTSKWNFGRLIDGEFFEPLPGEWGITEPLTIAAPNLQLSKSGPATLNLGQSGQFTLDVLNAGNSDAWTLTIRDQLPDGVTGGMCEATPEIISAQVFAADGTTVVPGKGVLVEDVDFTLDYVAAPACQLTLTTLTDQAVIGPGERLIITYSSELDPNSQEGASLTNLAAVVEWSNDDVSNSGRQIYTRSLTNGTVGTADHQDAHTLSVDLTGYFFEKTVVNLTSGEAPAVTAAPGDRLRYSLRLQTTDSAFTDFLIYDDLGDLNPNIVFEPGSLSLIGSTIPPGGDSGLTNPNNGTNGAGILQIENLNLGVNDEIIIQFDISVASSALDGWTITNQAWLLDPDNTNAQSDDPGVNGQSDPDVAGDEDPTQIVIQAVPPSPLQKSSTQTTAAIGETFSYQITIPAVPHSADLYDVRILDNLLNSAADLQFVDVQKVAGSGSWAPVNTGSSTNLVIEDPVNGIDIPAGEQVVVEVTVIAADTATNVAGLVFTNTAAYTYNQLDGDSFTQLDGGSDTSAEMTLTEPGLTLEKTGPVSLRIGQVATYTLDIQNIGDSSAYALSLQDLLPDMANGGMCEIAPAQITVQVFEADGTTPASPLLAAGTDYSLSFDGSPACVLGLTTLTAAAAIGPGQHLIVNYDLQLDPGTQSNLALTNIAGVTRWYSADISVPNDEARQYVRTITNGTAGVLDHEDAHTTVEFSPLLDFEKTVTNLTTGQDPAVSANPGDLLQYRIYLENVGAANVSNFTLVDELDRLNATSAFAPGTLSLVSVLPPSGDSSNTDAFGGAGGSGRLEIGNLDLAPGESLEVVFQIRLAPVVANASYVYNQSLIEVNGLIVYESDDPNVNGPADPLVANDEDPTGFQIQSAPVLDIDKISTDLSGDPNTLLAGETLRYRITVQNIGDDNVSGVVLRDQIPASTSYIAGSTRLNGNALADAGGTSPLVTGIQINSPRNLTAGYMPADASGATDNIATIEFDVQVSANLLDGAIVSNQGFVDVPGLGISGQPSDDPDTSLVDDPTRDVVGNAPLLFADKSVELENDAGSPGIIDPGDTLRYRIQVFNTGNIPATNARLTDTVPSNTTYVANSTRLNGDLLGTDNGAFPLQAGLDISSSDLTPPLPAAGEGTVSAGEVATIEFDVVVDAATPTGTLISNQALVATEEMSGLLTDGDGDPSTGPEPTVVVVGDAQQLSISKQVSVVGGGPALAGSVLEYLIQVTNIGAVAAQGVVVMDELDDPVAGQLTFVPGTATLNGSANGVTLAGTLLTADYSQLNGPLEPGESFTIRLRTLVNDQLAIGTTVTNTAVVTWNLVQTAAASATASIDVGGTPGSGVLNGSVWHDANFNNLLDSSEAVLDGWTVELYRNGQLVQTQVTDANGVYAVGGVTPNDVSGDNYRLAFVAPGAGLNTAMLGEAYSPVFATGLQEIRDIVIQSGNSLINLDLPIDPNGVVYDSISRNPIAGATLRLVDTASNSPLPGSCFEDPQQQNQVTGTDGYYKFDLNFSGPACPVGGNYSIDVTAPANGYVAGVSQIIPASSDLANPLDIPSCPGTIEDAIPGTGQYCEAQALALAPGTGVAARSAGTNYYLHLILNNSDLPGSGQIFNNHVPLDPILDGAIAIFKTTPQTEVSRGQLVPYAITLNNSYGYELQNINVVDRFPAGFRYIEGSATLNGESIEPVISGRELIWQDLNLMPDQSYRIQLLMGAGAGISEGEYTNRAQALNSLSGMALSGEASATVRLVPDPTFDCTDVSGKVFNDANGNGLQDNDETGIGNVRLVTARGLAVTTDNHGRFHITCAIVPNEQRGSNFVLKLDDRSLPSGYRTTTDMVKVERATRGKAMDFNFGASIHRVVSLDIADALFEPDTTQIRQQWIPRFALLMEELKKGPAILRLSYLADVEDPGLVNQRLDVVKKRIVDEWDKEDCCYQLIVEPEVFWRLGAPATQSIRQRAGGW